MKTSIDIIARVAMAVTLVLVLPLSANSAPNALESLEPVTYGGIEFPAGAISFADHAHTYRTLYSGGPAPDVTQQEFRQILGVPEVGEMSLGRGGRITVTFIDNRLTGSDDDTPDLYVFEVGAPETVHVEVANKYGRWVDVGTATGFAAGIDIDQYGFDSSDRIQGVRLTDDGDLLGDDVLTPGDDRRFLLQCQIRGRVRGISVTPSTSRHMWVGAVSCLSKVASYSGIT